jgi:hypothetical protein
MYGGGGKAPHILKFRTWWRLSGQLHTPTIVTPIPTCTYQKLNCHPIHAHQTLSYFLINIIQTCFCTPWSDNLILSKKLSSDFLIDIDQYRVKIDFQSINMKADNITQVSRKWKLVKSSKSWIDCWIHDKKCNLKVIILNSKYLFWPLMSTVICWK